MSVVSTENQEL
jgi:hypothetical protein